VPLGQVALGGHGHEKTSQFRSITVSPIVMLCRLRAA
jgi:hypothetical protein